MNPFLKYFSISLLVHCNGLLTALSAWLPCHNVTQQSQVSFKYKFGWVSLLLKTLQEVLLLSEWIPKYLLWCYEHLRFQYVWYLPLITAIHTPSLALWEPPLYEILWEVMVALSTTGPCPLDHRGEPVIRNRSVIVPHLLRHNDLSEMPCFPENKTESSIHTSGLQT